MDVSKMFENIFEEINMERSSEASDFSMSKEEPKNFQEYIGQEKTKLILERTIKACKIMDSPLPHMLIESRIAGFGKTTLAKLIINKIGRPGFWTVGSSLDSVSQARGILSSAFEKKNSIVLIDEIHRLKPNIAEIFYLPMEQFDKKMDVGGQSMVTKPFTVLGLTTQKGFLQKPFLDRFQFQVTLDDYTPEDLCKILWAYKNKTDFNISRTAIEMIVNRSFLIPRIAKSLLKNFAYFCIGGNDKSTIDELKNYFSLVGIDELGFDKYMVKILRALTGRKLGIVAMEKITQIDKRSLNDFYEPLLLRYELINYTRSGRELSAKGIKYLEHLDGGNR